MSTPRDKESKNLENVLVKSVGGEPVTMVVTGSYNDFVEVARGPRSELLPIRRAMARKASSELTSCIRSAYSDGDVSLLNDLWSKTVLFGER